MSKLNIKGPLMLIYHMAFTEIQVSTKNQDIKFEKSNLLQEEILQHHFAAACPQRSWVMLLCFFNLIFNRSQTKLSCLHSAAICRAIPALTAPMHYGVRVQLYI